MLIAACPCVYLTAAAPYSYTLLIPSCCQRIAPPPTHTHICAPVTPTRPQLCPAKRLREAAALRRPPAARLPLAAAFPATLGGAALLLASDTTAAAAALQGRFCDIFKDPAAACDWRTPLDTGYAAHLTGRGANSSSALRGGLAAAFSGLAAALPQLPASAPGFLSLSDPLEGLSEGVVQGAMYW